MIAAIAFAAAAASGGWTKARAIEIPKIAKPAYVLLALPQAVDGGPESAYPDVRIADSDGNEVPYALDATPQAARIEPVKLSDAGFVAGKYTQAIADLGTSGALHAAIVVTGTEPTYFEHVEVASSDDRTNWTVLVPDGLIYRVEQNGDAGIDTIGLGATRARWLRIRVLDPARRFPFDQIAVTADAPAPKLVALSAAAKTVAAGTSTVVTLDFGTNDTNLGGAAFETSTPQFSRQVSFAISNGVKADGAPNFAALRIADIARFKSGRPVVTVGLDDQHTRMLQVEIDNGNDPPLANLRVTALGYQHHLVFLARPDASYRLLWGADATAPSYDLAEKLAHAPWTVGAVASLGAAASTAFSPVVPAATPPPATPWLAQNALPVALVAGFAVLAVVVLLALRKAPS